MKREYDFRKAKRGAVVSVPKGKTRITIRLDDEILAWFREQVERAGGGNYQTVIGSGYLAGGLTDSLAGDIAIYAKHQGSGWGKNLFTGRDVYDVDHDIAVRSKLVFTPSDLTKLTLIGDYNNIKDNMNPSNLRPGSISPFEPGILQPDLGYDVNNNYQVAHPIETEGQVFGGTSNWAG